jgi:DNA-binding transcriptional regulator YdaS (Cro superfamily)
MSCLLEYLNALGKAEREAFAARCGTTVGYLRKAISVGQRLKADVCILIERESAGVVTCEALRPDVDWGYLRQSPAAQQPEEQGVVNA